MVNRKYNVRSFLLPSLIYLIAEIHKFALSLHVMLSLWKLGGLVVTKLSLYKILT